MLKTVITLLLLTLTMTACPLGDKKPLALKEDSRAEGEEPVKGRHVMFVGVDISGSFLRSAYFKDGIKFLARYIYAHLKGYDNLDVPGDLFVGSLGGAKPNEPKTFYPIQTFQHRSIKDIERKLFEIFPKNVENPFTDYNAFFEQISMFVRNKKLVLKPITIVMISDGLPDTPNKRGNHDYRSIQLKSLETLARDITLRVLYTSATTAMDWQTLVPRNRVKVWSQDARVMISWKDRHIMLPKVAFSKQQRFFSWLKDNVDFKVPRKRVD